MRLTAMIAASAAALAMSAAASMPATASYGDRYPDEPRLKREVERRSLGGRKRRRVTRWNARWSQTKRTPKRYKGSRWAKRAARRGGNPAAW